MTTSLRSERATAARVRVKAPAPAPKRLCRICSEPLDQVFVDLGTTPPCESYLSRQDLDQSEAFYPLCAYVCLNCFLVQLPEVVRASEIFRHYAYLSSYSDSWLQHAKSYSVAMIQGLGLTEKSLVMEVASNDGYLLQYFVEQGIPVLGIEPAANVAELAAKKGIRTVVSYFGPESALELASNGNRADLLIGNNVLAQVPDFRGFVRGLKTVLKPEGLITMEFPHLMRLVEQCQFDTIYHEHYSYFSFLCVEHGFADQGLRIYDVEELATHGGSLRIYACHADDRTKPTSPRVHELKAREEAAGVLTPEYYSSFSERVKDVKRKLLACLIDIKAKGGSIAAYGAAGKGNTLLNYCGIGTDFIDFVADRNPIKHGKYLPGSRIPIFPPEEVYRRKPDFILILPWNLKTEIMEQLSDVRQWGARFVVPIPEATIC